jgi:hypothetical protein
MAEQSSDNPIVKYLGAPIFAVFVSVLTWFAADSTTLQPALTKLAGVLGGICALVTCLLYDRNLGVLGASADPADSLEGSAYVRLRKSLSEGGGPATTYSRWLTKFLDAVDHFFGDAEEMIGADAENQRKVPTLPLADRTLFPHAFGLKTPAPLWTAAAFNRCLVLAFIYPIPTIFIIWAISGHVGPAEAALALRPDTPGWERVVIGATFWFLPLASIIHLKAPPGWRFLLFVTASVLAFAGGIIGLLVVALYFVIMELWRPPHGLTLSGPFAGIFGCAVAIAIAIVNPNSIIGVVIAAFAIASAWVGGTIVSALVGLGLLSLSQRGFRLNFPLSALSRA